MNKRMNSLSFSLVKYTRMRSTSIMIAKREDYSVPSVSSLSQEKMTLDKLSLLKDASLSYYRASRICFRRLR